VVQDNSTKEPIVARSSIRLEIFDDHDWADEVAQRLVSSLTAQPTARICLPTGNTPRPVYTACAPTIDLSSATVFLLDEFGLPPGSPARCDSMLQRDLLGSIAETPARYHRLDVNAIDGAAECARFDSLIADGGLDLTLLGLGGNGHLALNEPGTGADSPTRVAELAPSTAAAVRGYDPDADPTDGMTLGLQRILASDEIWLLVTGTHKAQILERTINGPISSDLPASFLRDHPNAVVYADRSAAALL
jgi:6-phosphogluconolactonase/glucosamine-6-phosphate isomerase/deaminase